MKKKLLWLIAMILVVMTVLLSASLLVGAEEPIPSASIDYCNLSFRDSVCIKYAARIENAETAVMLVWNTPQSAYVYGTQDAVLASSGTQEIVKDSGILHYVFDYTGLAAKQMTDEVYARANMRISFSKMTFPHRIARLLLLEQLYRGCKIRAHEAYHK